MPQSRYLFAFSCFKLDLLGEAEAALLPSEDYVEEVYGVAFLLPLLKFSISMEFVHIFYQASLLGVKLGKF